MHRAIFMLDSTRASVALLALLACAVASPGAEPMKALIIEGQNNHKAWPNTTKMMKQYLEETKLFSVDVVRTAPTGTDPNFHPDFGKYQVVVSNYNGAPWPEETRQTFVDYVKNGGGLVIVHAANNPFGDWKEYNRIIGVGGWGHRTEATGPRVYLDNDGTVVRDTSPGKGGHHGAQHEFQIVVRNSDHPITKGMPAEWKHAKDELYDSLRGPAEQMEVLATAYSAPDPKTKGTGHHEPMIFTVRYGKGRVFHTPMGHAEYSMECVGFITAFQRGAEWAATEKVTMSIPPDFPTAKESRARKYKE
jgi:type 1 glutamine amidotransferase